MDATCHLWAVEVEEIQLGRITEKEALASSPLDSNAEGHPRPVATALGRARPSISSMAGGSAMRLWNLYTVIAGIIFNYEHFLEM